MLFLCPRPETKKIHQVPLFLYRFQAFGRHTRLHIPYAVPVSRQDILVPADSWNRSRRRSYQNLQTIFNTRLFHTHVYRFAFASIFCTINVCMVQINYDLCKIYELISVNICSMESVSSFRIKFPKVANEGAFIPSRRYI